MADDTQAESPPGRSPLRHLGGLYFSPRAEFPSILGRPRFWIPLLAAVALNVLFTAVWMQKVEPAEFVKAQIEESGRADRIPPDRMEQVVEQQAKFFKVFGWVGPLVGVPLVVVVVGAVYLFVFRFFYGADVTFPQSLSIVAWSFLAVGLVSTPLVLATLALKGDWNINPEHALQANLCLFLDRESVGKAVWTLAGSLDLFTFWLLWLLSTGYGVAAKRPTASAAAGVLGIWAVYVLGKVALSAIF